METGRPQGEAPVPGHLQVTEQVWSPDSFADVDLSPAFTEQQRKGPPTLLAFCLGFRIAKNENPINYLRFMEHSALQGVLMSHLR